jgi:hypothetical protein
MLLWESHTANGVRHSYFIVTVLLDTAVTHAISFPSPLPQLLHLRLRFLQFLSQSLHLRLVGFQDKNNGLLHSQYHLVCSEERTALGSGGTLLVGCVENVCINLGTKARLDSMLKFTLISELLSLIAPLSR